MHSTTAVLLRAARRGLVVVAGLVVTAAAAPSADELARDFATPPPEARPGAMWYWRHEFHTQEGVTADLETMARVGIGEMLIGFIGGHDMPHMDMAVCSPKWWEMMRHTAREANRVGVKLRFFNSPGWSSTGGPWITPELSMQTLVWSEARHSGPGRLPSPLPHPPRADMSSNWRFTKEYGDSIKPFAYLGDVAVLAFPTPAAERWEGGTPKVTCDAAGFQYEAVRDGDLATVCVLANPNPGEPVWLRFDYGAPFPARSLSVTPSWSAFTNIRLESSDDAQTWRLVTQWTPRHPGDQPLHNMFSAAQARFWRIGITGSIPAFRIAEAGLSPGARVEDWAARGMSAGWGISRPPFSAGTDLVVRADEVVASGGIVDLTDRLKPDGTLDWEAPAGDWTLLRFGRIPTMQANAPAMPSGCGLECDKYNPDAVDLHWRSFIAPLLADKELNAAVTGVHIDSYEKRDQNWSPRIPAEFRKRAGYDVRLFLPALTGRVIDSIRTTERFLWDFRKTLCDAMADNYYGRMAELARENGKILSIEPYHQVQFDTDVVGTRGDAVVTEFHLGGWPSKAYYKNAASPAHMAGIRRVEAEAFTSMPKFGGDWSTAPWDLKALGDHSFCAGVNRYLFHVSNQQPWLDIFPGVASPWGQHIERGNTWFEFSYGWMRYIARCQYLLQQGIYRGDFLVFVGENSPNQGGVRLNIPPGYEFDNISAEAILNRLEFKLDRLTTGGLAAYGPLLVLPPDERYMTAALARKLKALVEAGVTLVGPRPLFSPSLRNQPEEDQALQEIAGQLWGDTDGGKKTRNRLGKGQVIWGEDPGRVLPGIFARPQFVGCDRRVEHIQRETDDAEIWFVANTGDMPVEGDCIFRTKASGPEFWDPMTGGIRPVAVWKRGEGTVTIPMRFEARGSCFVVFGQEVASGKWHVADGKRRPLSSPLSSTESDKARDKDAQENFQKYISIQELAGQWEVRFDPKWFYPDNGSGGKMVFERLIDWSTHSDAAVRYFSGTAVYRKEFSYQSPVISNQSSSAGLTNHRSLVTEHVPSLFLDLGPFKGIAEVHLNGRNLGTVWCAPWQIEITDALKPGRNELEIHMANCWPNRLIGDEQLPADAEYSGQGVFGGELKSWPAWLFDPDTPRTSGRRTFSTYKHWSKEDKLLPSGLIGPVRLMTIQ